MSVFISLYSSLKSIIEKTEDGKRLAHFNSLIGLVERPSFNHNPHPGNGDYLLKRSALYGEHRQYYNKHP